MSVVGRLRELEAAATPGPWQRDGDEYSHGLRGRPPEGDIVASWDNRRGGADEANIDLIAAMRNALPALLDIAEAAKACAERAYRGYGPEEAGWWSTLTDLEDALARLDDAAGQP